MSSTMVAASRGEAHCDPESRGANNQLEGEAEIMERLAAGAAAPRQTIVVVHGTYSSPLADQQLWWQHRATDRFSEKIGHALQHSDVDVRCWAHCSDVSPEFHWSGANDWVERVKASADLAGYVAKLHQNGWQCHLVGHSHGGNVIVEALHTLNGTPAHRAVRSVVTLGTPFLGTLSVLDRHKRRQRRLSASFMGIGAFFLLATLALILRERSTFGLEEGLLLGSTVAVILMGAWGFIHYAIRERSRRRMALGLQSIPALAINSPYDEAWQLLHHVRNTSNPIAVKSGLLSYLRAQMRSNVLRRLAVNRALSFAPMQGELPAWPTRALKSLHLITIGALMAPSLWHGPSLHNVIAGLVWAFSSFLGFAILIFVLGLGAWRAAFAYFQPVSALVYGIASIGIIPSECITYLVRARSWGLLQRWALGLEGFKFEMPNVELVPAEPGPAQFVHENLPEGAKERALRSRASWLEQSIGSAATTFSQMALSAADIRRLVEEIEQDPSLVHAAYYSDEESIRRIAGWISSHC